MDPPPVRYVTTCDGYKLAYTVTGSGNPFVFLPGVFNHVQDVWKGGSNGALLQALAERFQVLNYDARGMGMSTRELPPDVSIESYLSDLDEVLHRQGFDRFVLLGSHNSALLAGHYAALHPERVSALILLNSGKCWLGDSLPSLWDELPRQSWETFLFSLAPNSLGEDAARQFLAMVRTWIEQDAYLATLPVWRSASLEGVLSRIHTPTLVMKPRNCPCSRIEDVTELSGLLPNGRLVLMESDLSFGGPGQAIQAIDAFLAEVGQDSRYVRSAEEWRQGMPRPDSELTPREVQVLELIAGGATNHEIANALVVSVRTVERHITHIYAKIGARGKADATAFALRHSLA